MSNTLPGTYVKHVQKAPNKSILQESLNMSIIIYHVQHTTRNLCQTCSKGTQQVYFTRVSEHVNHNLPCPTHYPEPMSNMFKRHPTLSILQESLNMSIIIYHVQHTTRNLCQTCSKGTQLCLFNKRQEPLVCILLQLSSALQKIFFNQFGVGKFRIQLHP
jgi:trehalose-6-phosphate synthase